MYCFSTYIIWDKILDKNPCDCFKFAQDTQKHHLINKNNIFHKIMFVKIYYINVSPYKNNISKSKK